MLLLTQDVLIQNLQIIEDSLYQNSTAIIGQVTTLIQEWREYRERSMHAEDVKVVVMEAVSAAIKNTPLVQLTPQENLQSELSTDLQLWMGRVELTQVGFSLARPEKGEEEKRTGEYSHQVA